MTKPKEFKCANPKCGMKLLNIKTTDYGTPICQVDDLILCGGCGMPSKVTLEGTVMFTVAEFDKLSDDEKKDLEFAARAVTQKHVGHLRDQLRKVMTHDRN